MFRCPSSSMKKQIVFIWLWQVWTRSIRTIIQNTLPIVVTLSIVIYTICLNFSFYTRINSGKVTNEFTTYSYLSSGFLMFQIFCIAGYLFTYTNNGTKPNKTTQIFISASYILCFINVIFLIMMHVNLAYFSTDEITNPIT